MAEPYVKHKTLEQI